MSKFVALSGPSCIGKSPLYKALRLFHPELTKRLKKIVLYNDRSPRPGEQDGVDYHFRPRREIEALRRHEGFLVIPVRGDLQALEAESISRIIETGDNAFFEGNPFIVSALREAGYLSGIETTTVFISPLSREEILFFKNPERRVNLLSLVTDIMRGKLLRRAQKQKGILSARDLENIETRCKSAFREMQEAHHFDYVIPNHDGEDSENWDAFYYPIGEARRTLETFVSILNNTPSSFTERWEDDLI